MIGDTTVLATSGNEYNTAGGAPERVVEGGEVGSGGGGSSNSSEDYKNIMNRVVDEGERMNYGANRWPRQETLALLKIRSDMAALFRDSIPKGPLWEEVSRKLAELGYHRSAKKCKEKFENVYKYHKRTKDGPSVKSEGKHYRFFDQLQALDDQPPSKPPVPPQVAATITAPLPWSTTNPPPTVPSMPNPINAMPLNIITPPPTTNPTMPAPISSQPQNLHSQNNTFPSFQTLSTHLFSSSTSSSTASDDELEKVSKKRKRKWKDFFCRLTKNVIKKQEELQRKFLETVEKYENERTLREESWRMQEMARINREHEILIQERSSAAAKDAAVIQFLQKISGQQQISLPDKNINAIITPPPPPVQSQPPPLPAKPPPPPPAKLPAVTNLDFTKRDKGDGNATIASSSRWPKAEVQALINLRTNLDIKYQDNGPKGPLWEEISAGMKNLGYNRNAKRCKEKWENINKYFKKVKESTKKRSEDSKTCPYFFQLDALYKEKNKNNDSSAVNLNSAGYAANPISTVHAPILSRSEQQWPVKENQLETILADNERINMDQNFEDEDEDDEDLETEDDDEDGGGFEVVASKPPEASVGANGE